MVCFDYIVKGYFYLLLRFKLGYFYTIFVNNIVKGTTTII